jgi:hypothetical protein
MRRYLLALVVLVPVFVSCGVKDDETSPGSTATPKPTAEVVEDEDTETPPSGEPTVGELSEAEIRAQVQAAWLAADLDTSDKGLAADAPFSFDPEIVALVDEAIATFATYGLTPTVARNKLWSADFRNADYFANPDGTEGNVAARCMIGWDAQGVPQALAIAVRNPSQHAGVYAPTKTRIKLLVYHEVYHCFWASSDHETGDGIYSYPEPGYAYSTLMSTWGAVRYRKAGDAWLLYPLAESDVEPIVKEFVARISINH